MSTTPLLSIVIANYNYGRFLEEAIQSVLSQSCNDYELIVVDGGSTDNSVEIIKKYEDKIAWWVSEKDKGQSDAFNKGFARAKGQFLTWLNADDVMLPGVIEKLKCAVEKHPKCEWFVGGVLWLDPQMKVFKCGRARRMSKYRAYHGVVNVCGPSSFFTKNLFYMAGGIDERYQYTMDTDLWLRYALNQRKIFRPFIKYAWGLRLHPDAKMSGHKFSGNGEILEGKKSISAFKNNLKRLEQINKEEEWTNEKVVFNSRSMPKIMQLLSADYIPALFSRIDTRLYKGRKLSEIRSFRQEVLYGNRS